MTAAITASREDVLVQIGGQFVTLSVAVFEPAKIERTAIMLHGFAGNGHDFDAVAGPLAAAGFRVICPDMLGRGQSAWLSESNGYRFHTHVQVLVALINRYVEGQLFLVGTGWGAAMIMLTFKLARVKLAGVVLCAPPLRWHLAADPTLIEAAADADKTFATQLEGIRAVKATSLYAGAELEISTAMAANRLVTAPGGWRMAFDPALVRGKEALGARVYDMTPALEAAPAPVAILSVKTESADLSLGGPHLHQTVARYSAFLFTRPAEQALLLSTLDRLGG